MVCPVCNQSQVVTKNNRLFCNSCLIYIGTLPENAKSSNPGPTNPAVASVVHTETRFSTQKLNDQPIKGRSLAIIKNLTGVFVALVVLVTTFFSYFFYADFENGCYIKIYPSMNLEFSNGTIISGLKVLKRVAFSDYKKVCERIKTIRTDVSCAGYGGGCHYSSDNQTIYVSSSRENLVAAATIIVHETCHEIQSYEKRPGDEIECYQADDKIYQKIVIH